MRARKSPRRCKPGGYGKREVIVRVNALATPWGRDDIAAAGAAGPDGMLAPKVESAAQVKALDDAMSAAGFSARRLALGDDRNAARHPQHGRDRRRRARHAARRAS